MPSYYFFQADNKLFERWYRSEGPTKQKYFDIYFL